MNSSLGQSFGSYQSYRDGSRTLDAIAFHQTSSVTLTGDGEPERVEMASVTWSFFDVFRTSAVLGRVFRPDERRARGGPGRDDQSATWEQRARIRAWSVARSRSTAPMGLLGIGVGLAGGLATTRFMRSMLYGIGPGDPLTFGATASFLFIVILAAAAVPAERASRLDPAETLRAD